MIAIISKSSSPSSSCIQFSHIIIIAAQQARGAAASRHGAAGTGCSSLAEAANADLTAVVFEHPSTRHHPVIIIIIRTMQQKTQQQPLEVEEANLEGEACGEEEGDETGDVGGAPREKMYRRAGRKEFLDKLLTSSMMEIVLFGTTAMDEVHLLLVLIFHRLLRDKKAHPRPVGWPENGYHCCHCARLMTLSRSHFRHLEVSAFKSEAEWNAFNAANKQQGKPSEKHPAAGALSAEVSK